MDHKTSWSKLEDIRLPGHFNLLMHSDGGTRPTCSAVAWVVEAIFFDAAAQEWKQMLVAMSTTFLETPISSFTAEALALYQCSDFVKTFINKHV